MNQDNEIPHEFWGVVELMGHQQVAGKLSKSTLFGIPLLRVDVPDPHSETGFVTKLYGDAAIYGIHITDEAGARLIGGHGDTGPVSPWSLSALLRERGLPEPEDTEGYEDDEPREDPPDA